MKGLLMPLLDWLKEETDLDDQLEYDIDSCGSIERE